MLAFHNDPSLKDFVLGQLATHRETDKLVHGKYWEDGKGCAVGCTLEAVRLRKGSDVCLDHSSHALYETELGIPWELARIEDLLFENLPNAKAQLWPERFTSAIRPGADLALIVPRFFLWLLTEELPQHAAKFPKCTAAMSDVAALYREWTETGKNPDPARWRAARDTAREARDATYAAAAATYAAAAATYAAAAATYAAAAATYAAAAADAAAAAADAAAAATWREAREKAFERYSDKLIELLEAA